MVKSCVHYTTLQNTTEHNSSVQWSRDIHLTTYIMVVECIDTVRIQHEAVEEVTELRVVMIIMQTTLIVEIQHL